MIRKDNKGRILRKGETQRSDGRYCFRWNSDGKRKCVYALDLIDLRDKEKKIERETYAQVYDEGQTLNDAFDRYISTKNALKEGTLNNYLLQYDLWVRDTWLGNKRISIIKKSDILYFYKEKSESLSNGSIRNIQKYIYAALQLAVEDDLIYKNPAVNCTRDYGHRQEKKALTIEQTKKLLAHVEVYPARREYPVAVKVMLETGMRVGETVGLTWKDIDFANKMIHVNKQFKLISGRGKYDFHISSTKTENSVRSIPMSDDICKILLAYKKASYFQSMKYDAEVDGYKGFVFFNNSGLPVNPQNINKYLKRLVMDYNKTHEDGLPEVTCHILRHTFCTRMAEKRISPKTLQKIMGHSSYTITSDIYITETDEHMKEEFFRVMNQ